MNVVPVATPCDQTELRIAEVFLSADYVCALYSLAGQRDLPPGCNAMRCGVCDETSIGLVGSLILYLNM